MCFLVSSVQSVRFFHFLSSHGYRFQASEFYFKPIGNIKLMWIIHRGSEWGTCLFHPYGHVVISPPASLPPKKLPKSTSVRQKMALFLFSNLKGKTKVSSQGALLLSRSHSHEQNPSHMAQLCTAEHKYCWLYSSGNLIEFEIHNSQHHLTSFSFQMVKTLWEFRKVSPFHKGLMM